MPRTAPPRKEPDPPEKRRLGPRAIVPTLARAPRLRKAAKWALIALAVLVIAGIAADVLLDEPLRRTIEGNINRSLTGYTARVPELDFRILGLSVALRDVVVTQDAHPSPPVLVVPELVASVHWRQLIFLRLVADFRLEKPRLHANLAQLRSEDRDSVPLDEKGWQDALQAIYPLKVNLLRVDDGDVTYIDQDPKKPLRLRHLDVRAANIRNIHSPDNVYPSPIHASAEVFEGGHASIIGHANFLAKPFPGIHVLFDVRDVPLNDLGPVVERADLTLHGGHLSTNGRLEYAPSARNAHVKDVTIRGVRLDYVQKSDDGAAGKAVRKVAKAAEESEMKMRLDRLRVLESNIGLQNASRDYRVFLNPANLVVEGFTNFAAGKPAVARLEGLFMGTGKTDARARFRAGKNGPDLTAKVSIENTKLAGMNDILRSHGKFDVTAGVFSLYSEVRVENGAVSGYVKPLFQDMEVYDAAQDRKKSIFKKVYESVVEWVGEVLENQSRDEVASVVQLRGRVTNPESSTLQVVFSLIENAFFEAILPGFEREASLSGRVSKRPKD
jgi:hypothetical protein